MNPEKPLSDGGHAMATRPTPDAALCEIMGMTKVAYYSSFPVDDRTVKSAVFAALTGESQDLKSQINRSISVRGFLVKPSDPKLSQDGEIQVYPVSFLICTDGNVYRTGSRGVLQALRLIEADRGNSLWDPPVDCVPSLRNLGGDPPRQWFYLSIPEKE